MSASEETERQLQQWLHFSAMVSGQGIGGVANSSTCDKSQVWHGDLPFVLEGNAPFHLRLVKMKRLLLSQSSSVTPFVEPLHTRRRVEPGEAPGVECCFRNNRACSWRIQMLGSPKLPDLKTPWAEPRNLHLTPCGGRLHLRKLRKIVRMQGGF